MKGNSTTHVYTDKGRQNHDNVIWNSSAGKCINRRNIGKGRNICIVDSKMSCPQKGGEFVQCPINHYEPVSGVIIMKTKDLNQHNA